MNFKPTGSIADEHLFVQPPERDNSVIVVVDGDELSYVTAAACEQRGVTITNTQNEKSQGFKNKTEFFKMIKSLEYPDDLFTVEETQVAEPPQNAYSTVKKKLFAIRERFNTDNIEIYIGGVNNFRDSLPLPVKYKGGTRDNAMRPILLDDIKNYLVQYHKAIVVDDIEADDFLSIRSHAGFVNKQKIIAYTQDKDRLATMGWSCCPDRGKVQFEPLYVDGLGLLEIDDKKKVRGHGRKWLYFQWIAGDKADVYCPRDLVEVVKGKKPVFGEKKAYDLLVTLETDKECLQAVHDLYLDWFGKEQFSYTTWDGKEVKDVDYIFAMQVYLDCCRMLRWEGDKVRVRDMLNKMGVITVE